MKGSNRFKKLKLTVRKEDSRQLPSAQDLLDRASTTSQNELVSELVASYIDALAVDEIIETTVTPTVLGSKYEFSKFVTLKDTKKSSAPAILAARVVGSGSDKKYQSLPLYVFATTLESTTSSFFITEWAKVFSQKNQIHILGRTGSPAPLNFVVVVLKDKIKK